MTKTTKDISDDFLNDTAAPGTATPPPAAPATLTTSTTKASEKAKSPEKTKAPEKPQPRVLKVYHRFGSEKVPANLPVSTQMCPPITKRKFAIYELLNYKNAKGERARDMRVIEGDSQIEPQPYELSPVYTIYDRFETDLANRDKIIQFIDGTEQYMFENPMTGNKEPRVRAKVVTPFFSNGQKIVDVEAKYMQYLWWELHPRNQSNKFHDKRKKPIFRRVDLDHVNPATELAKYTLRTQAHLRIDKMLDTQKLIGLATALKIPAGMPPSDLRLELHRLVDRDAEKVLYAEGDPTATTRLDIHKAMDMGIIDYVPDVQQFFFTNDQERPLHTVLMGKDPVDDLATFLGSEQGEDAYKEMVDILNYWK